MPIPTAADWLSSRYMPTLLTSPGSPATPGITVTSAAPVTVSAAVTPPSPPPPDPPTVALPSVLGLHPWAYHIEVHPHGFLAVFSDGAHWHHFNHAEIPALIGFVTDPTKALIGFGSAHHDDALLRHVCLLHPHTSPEDIADLSAQLRDPELRHAEALRYCRYGNTPWGCCVDMAAVLNHEADLREWGCMIGATDIVDNPVPAHRNPTAEDLPAVERAGRVAVGIIMALYIRFIDRVALREAMTASVVGATPEILTMTDAALGEQVVVNQLVQVTGIKKRSLKRDAWNQEPATTIPVADLIAPSIAFQSEPFRAAADVIRAGTIAQGALRTALAQHQVELAGVVYAFGLGGLHSVDAPVLRRSGANHILSDLDVTSFYPSIILNQRVLPEHLPEDFQTIYRGLVEHRIAAKANGDTATANAMKIIINAVYGKFNAPGSALYDPRCTYTVTINGQLLLLMLIERLVDAGAEIISANTDGVVIASAPGNQSAITAATAAWQAHTGLVLERSDLRCYASTAMGSYVIVTTAGTTKVRGCFSHGRQGKIGGEVIAKAAVAQIIDNRSVADYINAHTIATDFLYFQRAKLPWGFANGTIPLPNTLRWYAAHDGITITEVNTTKRITQLAKHGLNVRLALTLYSQSAADLEGLNRSPYIEAANALITKVTSHT